MSLNHLDLSRLGSVAEDKLKKLQDVLCPQGAELFLVGGAVRDLLMEKAPFELDIEVYGIDSEKMDELMTALGADGVGKSFFVYKWEGLDIALPRKERKTAAGHRGFAVEVESDLQAACSRRDFTMNSMMISLENGQLFDFFGGRTDIKAKLIRMTDARSFGDDSLRVLRAIQFSGRLGFRIEKKTLDICRQTSLDDLPKERIWAELGKLCMGALPYFGFYYLVQTGAFKKLFGCELKEFLPSALQLARAYRYTGRPKDELLFFYVIQTVTKLPILKFLKTVGAPSGLQRRYRQQPMAPKNPTHRFLAAVSLRYPLVEWTGIYRPNVAKEAERLNILHAPLKLPFSPTDLLNEGFSGQALGIELRQRRSQWIRHNFKGIKCHHTSS